MGQQSSPYVISARGKWLLRLLKNEESQAHNGRHHGRKTIKLQPVHGLPAEPKQTSQTSDSSAGQMTCTCCISPVLLVYFHHPSVTHLCSIINIQCTEWGRLIDGINSVLYLCIFVAKRVISLHPILLSWKGVFCSDMEKLFSYFIPYCACSA